MAALWLGGCSGGEGGEGWRGESPPAPVAVSPVEVGSIEQRRTFSGTLQPRASFFVAPKVGGRIEEMLVDFGDSVGRNELVVQIDDAEFQQEVLRAEADLAVAEANLAEAQSLFGIAEREIERFETLRERGFTSASQYETSEAEREARGAQLRVAEAQVSRAEAALESARIRLSYTRVVADWNGPGEERVVGERFFDEGDTVTPNTSLLRVVEIDPIVAEIYVTEKDYAMLRRGQTAQLLIDAFPGETFEGTVDRVSPVFREATRQALVELQVPNPGQRLKPGMFARVSLGLQELEGQTIVPETALVRRDDTMGVFVVNDEGSTVRWVQVEVLVSNDERIAVEGEGLRGRVVTLGQQMLEDGSAIVIPDDRAEVAEEVPT